MDKRPQNQRTIATSTTIQGFGYWSGRDVQVELRPAAADTGIQFVRTDLDPNIFIPATIAYRVEMPRRTTIAVGKVRVEMIEHLMAALAGLGVDNCEVRVDQTEMPGLDGSSQLFVEALDDAGIVELAALRRELTVSQSIRLGNIHHWIEARPPQSPESLRVIYHLDYGEDNPIGKQKVQFYHSSETFRSQLARCRTFLLKEEADWLQSNDLGTRVSTQDLLVFDDAGPIDNQLLFENECVRHKALDLIGDLALAGRGICGEIEVYRGGHRLHAQLVAALVAEAGLSQPTELCHRSA